MSVERKIKQRTLRRVLRTRKNITSERRLPRVAVFRSLKHIYAQVIDDSAHRTLAACCSSELKDATGDKKSVARAVGLALADRAQKIGVTEVVFDRGGYLYHGRVRSLADGLREGGLKV